MTEISSSTSSASGSCSKRPKSKKTKARTSLSERGNREIPVSNKGNEIRERPPSSARPKRKYERVTINFKRFVKPTPQTNYQNVQNNHKPPILVHPTRVIPPSFQDTAPSFHNDQAPPIVSKTFLNSPGFQENQPNVHNNDRRTNSQEFVTNDETFPHYQGVHNQQLQSPSYN